MSLAINRLLTHLMAKSNGQLCRCGRPATKHSEKSNWYDMCDTCVTTDPYALKQDDWRDNANAQAYRDLEAMSDGASATVKNITLMLAASEFIHPTPYDNLPEGIRFCLDLVTDPFIPANGRELLRNWVQDAHGILHHQEDVQR